MLSNPTGGLSYIKQSRHHLEKAVLTVLVSLQEKAQRNLLSTPLFDCKERLEGSAIIQEEINKTRKCKLYYQHLVQKVAEMLSCWKMAW